MTVKEYAKELTCTEAEAFMEMVRDSEYYDDPELTMEGDPYYDPEINCWLQDCRDQNGHTYQLYHDETVGDGEIQISYGGAK